MLFKNHRQIINNGYTPELKKARKNILDIFSSAIEAVDPYNAVKSRFHEGCILLSKKKLDLTCFKDIYLVGFGKASVGMAKAVYDSSQVKEGVIITNDPENKLDTENIKIIVGSHPIPDENCIKGAGEVIKLIKKCDENDLLIVLISGGGSALLSKPRISLKDLQKTTDLLLKSGANINEINTIRKHLSYVKGGQLIKHARCKVISFIISDVIGDPLEFISSGPTYPDSTTFFDAEKILTKYELLDKIPKSVIEVLNDGKRGVIEETPKPNDKIFNKVKNIIVANNKKACEAAEKKAKELGYKTLFLTSSLDGEAREVGKYLIEKAANHLHDKKMVFISGGETTVTVKGSGSGGRNQEMVLGAVEFLKNKDIVFSSFATDGIDGTSDASGAIADGFTLERAAKKGITPKKYLDNNNSYEFFKELGDLLFTGSTGTNLMDLQIILK